MDFDVIYLNGGKAARLWPVTLDNSHSIYSKSIVRLAGQTNAETALLLHRQAGARNLHVITKGTENSEQLLSILRQASGNIFGYERFTYTHPERDPDNTGNATAVVHALIDQPHLNDTVIVLPNDNHIEYNVQDALDYHIKTGALITMLTTRVSAAHGLSLGIIRRNEFGTLEDMIEKAGNLDLLAQFLNIPYLTADSEVVASGGAYIIDAKRLRQLMQNNEVWAFIKDRIECPEGFDIAKDFIPYFMSLGQKVQTYDIIWADMGGLNLLMDTVQRALNREFPYLTQILSNKEKYVELPNNVWIHRETYEQLKVEEKTLRERNERGEVQLGPNVFMGRNIHVYDEVAISNSEVERDSMLGKGVKIDHSYASTATQVADYAQLYHSITAHAAEVGPYSVLEQSVIGHLNVPTGTNLYQCVVWPDTDLVEGGRYERQILYDEALMKLKPGWNWPTEELMSSLPYTVAQL